MKIDPKNFASDVLGATGPVLVDFFGVHCPPCRQLAPVIDKLEKDYPVCKVDIELHPELAQQHRITSIPTLILFKDGKPMERLVGLQSEAKIRALFAAAQ